jgi:hypothetical protein
MEPNNPQNIQKIMHKPTQAQQNKKSAQQNLL